MSTHARTGLTLLRIRWGHARTGAGGFSSLRGTGSGFAESVASGTDGAPSAHGAPSRRSDEAAADGSASATATAGAQCASPALASLLPRPPSSSAAPISSSWAAWQQRRAKLMGDQPVAAPAAAAAAAAGSSTDDGTPQQQQQQGGSASAHAPQGLSAKQLLPSAALSAASLAAAEPGLAALSFMSPWGRGRWAWGPGLVAEEGVCGVPQWAGLCRLAAERVCRRRARAAAAHPAALPLQRRSSGLLSSWSGDPSRAVTNAIIAANLAVYAADQLLLPGLTSQLMMYNWAVAHGQWCAAQRASARLPAAPRRGAGRAGSRGAQRAPCCGRLAAGCCALRPPPRPPPAQVAAADLRLYPQRAAAPGHQLHLDPLHLPLCGGGHRARPLPGTLPGLSPGGLPGLLPPALHTPRGCRLLGCAPLLLAAPLPRPLGVPPSAVQGRGCVGRAGWALGSLARCG
jgi:hypothetical protein